MMSSWDKGAPLSKAVTRDILLSERGSIASLNDLPPSMIDEARAAQRVAVGAAVRYLTFFIEKIDLSQAEDFINDVLIGGQDAATWRIEDCLIAPHPHTPERVFARPYWEGLLRGEHDKLARFSPASEIRGSNMWAGVVGVLKTGTRYWETAPAGFTRLFFGSAARIELVATADVDIYTRRWLAHVLSRWTHDYREQQGVQVTAEGLLGAVRELAKVAITDDARGSAAALAREITAFGDSADFRQHAGFLGPDDWYRPEPTP